MKTIQIDEELYRYIASHTQHIGENASDILRRMLKLTVNQSVSEPVSPNAIIAEIPTPVVEKEIRLEKKPTDRVRAMRELLLSDEYAEQNKSVNRFLLILTTLYAQDTSAFAEATEALHGRTRVYFAYDEATLLQSGNHTKPKQVPETPYWVITNTNTSRKRSMVEHIMSAMHFPTELTEKVCGTI